MAEQDSVKSFSILIVEDSAPVSRTLQRLISRYPNVTTKAVESLGAAEAVLSERPFDLILWDGELDRDPDSVEKTKKVIARFQHRAQIHVAMSGSPGAQDMLLGPGLCTESAPKPTTGEWLKDFLTSRFSS